MSTAPMAICAASTTARSRTQVIQICVIGTGSDEIGEAVQNGGCRAIQVPVITLESGREAALAVVCIAHAGNGSLRTGLAAGIPGRDEARATQRRHLTWKEGRDDDARGYFGGRNAHYQ